MSPWLKKSGQGQVPVPGCSEAGGSYLHCAGLAAAGAGRLKLCIVKFGSGSSLGVNVALKHSNYFAFFFFFIFELWFCRMKPHVAVLWCENIQGNWMVQSRGGGLWRVAGVRLGPSHLDGFLEAYFGAGCPQAGTHMALSRVGVAMQPKSSPLGKSHFFFFFFNRRNIYNVSFSSTTWDLAGSPLQCWLQDTSSHLCALQVVRVTPIAASTRMEGAVVSPLLLSCSLPQIVPEHLIHGHEFFLEIRLQGRVTHPCQVGLWSAQAEAAFQKPSEWHRSTRPVPDAWDLWLAFRYFRQSRIQGSRADSRGAEPEMVNACLVPLYNTFTLGFMAGGLFLPWLLAFNKNDWRKLWKEALKVVNKLSRVDYHPLLKGKETLLLSQVCTNTHAIYERGNKRLLCTFWFGLKNN